MIDNKKDYSRVALIIIIIFLLLSIFIGYWLMRVGEIFKYGTGKDSIAHQISSNEIDGPTWQTYHDDLYNINFRYPITWKVTHEYNALLKATSTIISPINSGAQTIVIGGFSSCDIPVKNGATFCVGLSRETLPGERPSSYTNSKDDVELATYLAITPTIKSEIVDWKTYKNDKYGFEVTYPPDFPIFEDVNYEKGVEIPVTRNSNQVFITNKPNFQSLLNKDSDASYLLIQVLDKYTDIMDTVKKIKDDAGPFDNNHALVSEGYVMINGENFYKVFISGHSGSVKYIINHNGASYLLSEYDEVKNQNIILNSFKFTK